MSDIQKVSVNSKLLNGLRVPSYGSKVLLKTVTKNEEATTPSGILMIADTDWEEARHSNRLYKVVSLPKRLPFHIGSDEMPWDTHVEISEGWLVYVDYLATLNCQVFEDEEGNEYKILDYSDLYVGITDKFEGEDFDEQTTKDGKWYVRCLNGYSLFEEVYVEKKGEFDVSADKVDPRRGIVRYVAVGNKAYENGIQFDHFNLKVGDVVRFSNVPPVMLEDETYCSFDGGTMYRRSQSRNIELLWRDGEMLLPDGNILISKVADERETDSGIVLAQPDNLLKNHTGTVILSSNKEVSPGATVRYIKGSGYPIDYKDGTARILRTQEVLYVE